MFERQYTSDLEGSQVYAAYKYPRKDVKAVRPGRAVAAARRFLPDMMEVAYDGSTRRVGPFEMLPGTAAGARRRFAVPDRGVRLSRCAVHTHSCLRRRHAHCSSARRLLFGADHT